MSKISLRERERIDGLNLITIGRSLERKSVEEKQQ